MSLINCIWADIARPANTETSIDAYIRRCMTCNPDRVFLTINDAAEGRHLSTWDKQTLVATTQEFQRRGIWVGWMYHVYNDLDRCEQICGEWHELFESVIPSGLQCDAEQWPWNRSRDSMPAAQKINDEIQAMKEDFWHMERDAWHCEYSATTITAYPTDRLRDGDMALLLQPHITHAYNQAYLFWDGREGHWSQSLPHTKGLHQRNVAKPWFGLYEAGTIDGWFTGCANYGQSFPASSGIVGLDAMRWGVEEAREMAAEGTGCMGVAWWSLKHATPEKLQIMDIHNPQLPPPSKEEIKSLQTALNASGYPCGKVDGFMGVKTNAAMDRYLEERGRVREARNDELYRHVVAVRGPQ